MAVRESEQQKFKRSVHLTREEQYEEALKKSVYAFQRVVDLGLTDTTDLFYFREPIDQAMPFPLGLHFGMFIPTILKQGTSEQKGNWLPRAWSLDMIGTYAQTELGHGTFLRGLETTATYDPKTQEFVINSPTITSAKFWPGGLGKTANHCVVMAKLITQGKNEGMQSFMVQIRDVETHQPLPGIEVGDIGPKFGYGSMDNGYLRFDNVRIPRENMLMRYAQVLEDGTFIKPKNDRLVYGSMTLIRAQIVGGAARALQKSVTIATRYSAVRRQSHINSGQGEVQVIDFQTQQHKLIPQIAIAYALNITGKRSIMEYNRVSKQIESGSLEELPVLHALSAGLKAYSTWEMMYGIEQCRLACGGHGYLAASGLPKIYSNEVPGCTYEGENTVMCLQTARYLMKCYAGMRSGEALPSMVGYLKTARGGKSGLTAKLELDKLIQAYEHRAARMISEAGNRLADQQKKGMKPAEAWNMTSQMLVEASLAFCQTFAVRAFITTVTEASMPASLKAVMTQLCQLFAVQGILKFSGQFTKGGYMSDKQIEVCQDRLFDLLAQLKPNAVALVDAFDFPDMVLDSDLGRYDGNVYEALMNYARSSKLNQTEVHEGFFKYQKPFVDALNGKKSEYQARL